LPERRPTIADVAKRARVSPGAVSFALNDRPGVAPATRLRILEAAEELGWRPSARARALSRSKAFSLGLVMSRDPELIGADPFFPQFLAGVEATLPARGYALLLQVVGEDARAEENGYRRLAGEGRVDGVFLTDLRRNDSRFELLAELGLAAVAVGRPEGACPFPSVAPDDRVGARAAIAHLISLGHTDIAHVAGAPSYVHSESRRAVWRDELQRAGLREGPVVSGDFTGPEGARATIRLINSAAPPTAIFFANDLMAVAGMSAAVAAGVRVPLDLSVAGFDDIPLAAHVTPALTTVRQDVASWGRAAADTLLAVVEGAPPPPLSLEPPELIVRASTGPPRKAGGPMG